LVLVVIPTGYRYSQYLSIVRPRTVLLLIVPQDAWLTVAVVDRRNGSYPERTTVLPFSKIAVKTDITIVSFETSVKRFLELFL
jgi:hypothetical protein